MASPNNNRRQQQQPTKDTVIDRSQYVLKQRRSSIRHNPAAAGKLSPSSPVTTTRHTSSSSGAATPIATASFFSVDVVSPSHPIERKSITTKLNSFRVPSLGRTLSSSSPDSVTKKNTFSPDSAGSVKKPSSVSSTATSPEPSSSSLFKRISSLSKLTLSPDKTRTGRKKPVIGIKLAYLLSLPIKKEWNALDTLANVIMPFTQSQVSASYVDVLLQTNVDLIRENPDVFMLYSWNTSVVDALQAVASSPLGSIDDFVFIDIFCLNQVGSFITAQDSVETITGCIRACKRVEMVVNSIRDPAPFRRLWCLYEINTAIEHNCVVHVCAPPQEIGKFKTQIERRENVGLTMFRKLFNISLKLATCTRDGDVDVVRANMMEKDMIVETRMQDLYEKFLGQIIGNVHPHEMYAFACMIHARGRTTESLALFESALQLASMNAGVQDWKSKPDACVGIAGFGTDVNNLGWMMCTSGKADIARRLLQIAIQVGIASNHGSKLCGDVALRLNNLAAANAASGNIPLAKTLLEESLDILTKIPKQNHPIMGVVLNNLACLNDNVEMGRKSVWVFREVLDRAHPWCMEALEDWGVDGDMDDDDDDL